MPRKNNPKETVERIINAGMQLFQEKGFEQTSMLDIVEVSDMSKGAIFYHFKTKEEIFEAAMERQYDIVTKMLYDWLAEPEMKTLNAKEKLIAIIKRNVTDKEMAASNEKFMKIGINNPHLILAHMKQSVLKGAPVMAAIIKEGIADGSVVTDFPDEAAELFLHLINFWCDPLIFGGDMTTIRRRHICFQQIMKNLGVDLITDELIEFSMELTEKYYSAVTAQSRNNEFTEGTENNG